MYINDYEVYVGGSKIGKIVMNNEVTKNNTKKKSSAFIGITL